MTLFVRKGVAETTVRDIAQAVDISEGALYRHFVSKEELVWQLFERHYVAFAARLQALADSQTTARGREVMSSPTRVHPVATFEQGPVPSSTSAIVSSHGDPKPQRRQPSVAYRQPCTPASIPGAISGRTPE